MKKINIAELLHNCPQGMELDCTMYDNVYFKCIREHAGYPIVCYVVDGKGEKHELSFNWYGKHSPIDTAKCVIFPKGKTTWEGFIPPCQFNDGDVIFTHTNALKCNLDNNWVSIFKEYRNNRCACYVCLCLSDLELYHDKWEDELLCKLCEIEESRLATEEEKQKLFNAIKENGYKWNAETKTLERLVEPKFKVGDKVLWNYNTETPRVISKVELTSKRGYVYWIDCKGSSSGWWSEDELTPIPNKFDITTLKPFDKVLVKDNVTKRWIPSLFGYLQSDDAYPYVVIGGVYWRCCIPYEGNEHLLGTTDDCDEYYKTWE